MLKNKLYIFAVLVLLINQAFSQENWTQVYNDKNITLYTKEADCHLEHGINQRWFLLKIVNHTNNQLNVEWDLQLFDLKGNECLPNSAKENHKNIQVPANETLEGICSYSAQKELHVAERFLDFKTVKEVYKVNLVNITIKEIKK